MTTDLLKIINPIPIIMSMVTTNIDPSAHSVWLSIQTYNANSDVVADNIDGVPHEYTWLPPDEDNTVVADSNYPPATHSVIRRDEMNPDAKSVDDDYRHYWLDRGPTNQAAMFDQRSRRASTRAESMTVTVAPGTLFNALALVNVKADTLTVTVDDPIDGQVYSKNIDMLDLSNVYDIYTWCFAPILKKKTVVLTDLPYYPDATVTIVANNPGEETQIGEFVVGQVIEIGIMKYGMALSGDDYSKLEEDDDGTTTIEIGSYSKELVYPVKLPSTKLNYVANVFDDLRSRPAVFIGKSDREESIIYGLCTDFSESYDGETTSSCSITVKEVSR